jgi:hypothetical protein
MDYSKARYKLKHTAFIELNQEAVVRTMYADDDCMRHKRFRVFLIRCKRNSGMPGIDAMFRREGPDEQLVTVTPPTTTNQTDTLGAYSPSLRIRLARVILKDGTIEVLATSVLDEAILSHDDLAELYWPRWGIETFYGIVKTRLTLENFSGLSPDAVRQDFFSTVLLCGIETIVTADAEEQLVKQKGGHPKKVNKAISFSAIKTAGVRSDIRQRVTT